MKMVCTAAAALVPAIVIASLLHIRRKPVSVIRSISDAYPLLRERLPTAYDNADSSGIVVDDLADGVSIDAGSVRRSAIISKKGLLLRMVASLVLVSLLMFISSPEAPRFLTPEELESMITPPTDEEREEAADDAHQQQLMSELGSESGSGSGDAEIYGKPSVAVIEGTNIELVMFSDAGVGHSSRRTEPTSTDCLKRTGISSNSTLWRWLRSVRGIGPTGGNCGLPHYTITLYYYTIIVSGEDRYPE